MGCLSSKIIPETIEADCPSPIMKYTPRTQHLAMQKGLKTRTLSLPDLT